MPPRALMPVSSSLAAAASGFVKQRARLGCVCVLPTGLDLGLARAHRRRPKAGAV